jgi:hypothetical protein
VAQNPCRIRVPGKEASAQLALEPATIKDVEALVAFERKMAEDRTCIKPLLELHRARQS